MKVLLDPVHAAPVLRHIAPDVRKRLKHALRLLSKDPSGRLHRIDVKRLDVDAGPPMYRARIGDWRIAFTVDDALVVLRVFHRDDGYGWLQDMD